jgi:hypothetical protein
MLELFGNVLDNACQWAASRVSVSVRQGPGIHAVVEDDGPGVEEVMIGRLVQPGFRLDESTPGHGLGFAIARDVVEQYGGWIEFGRSVELGGLRVEVHIPLPRPEAVRYGGSQRGVAVMPRLIRSIQAWGTPRFEAVLREEIAQLGAGVLPLQAGLTSGSIGLDDKVSAMILGVTEAPDAIRVRAGIFYTSILAGCACADDPTPENENAEYCQVELEIDRASGEARVRLEGG